MHHLFFCAALWGAFTALPLALGDSQCGVESVTADEVLHSKLFVDAYLAEKSHARRLQAPITFAPVVVPTYYHLIRPTADTPHISAETIAEQHAALNFGFLASGFSFDFRETTYTTNSAWFNCDMQGADDWEMRRYLRQGGKNALNVFITNGADVLGYASFPEWLTRAGFGKDHDGVVIKYTVVPGGGQPSLETGDILVHEVGHWLGLFHTFQGGCGGVGDGISDTPAQLVVGGCPQGIDTCPGEPGHDPIHNHMGYTNDACRSEFTPYQKLQMQAKWELRRPDATKLDVVVLADVSGSFIDDQAAFKAQAALLISQLEQDISDVQFGVATFSDYPIVPFGIPGRDQPYVRIQDLTPDQSIAVNHIQKIPVPMGGDGGDGPESQLTAVQRAAIGPDEFSWRSDAQKLILLWTDASFHFGGEPGYPGPSMEETLLALESIAPGRRRVLRGATDRRLLASPFSPLIVGLTPNGRNQNLTALVRATGAIAGESGVDCDGDGRVSRSFFSPDVRRGQAIVCGTASGSGIAQAMVAVAEAAMAAVRPVAVCTDVITITDYSSITAAASVDGGSYDPLGNSLASILAYPPGPYGIGQTQVTLFVTSDEGISSTCNALVTVRDGLKAACTSNSRVPSPIDDAGNDEGIFSVEHEVLSTEAEIPQRWPRPSGDETFTISGTDGGVAVGSLRVYSESTLIGTFPSNTRIKFTLDGLESAVNMGAYWQITAPMVIQVVAEGASGRLSRPAFCPYLIAMPVSNPIPTPQLSPIRLPTMVLPRLDRDELEWAP